MYLLDENNRIDKYDNIQDIIYKYYTQIIEYQNNKKINNIKNLKTKLELVKIQIKFIELEFNGDIKVSKRAREDVIKDLIKYEIPDETQYNEKIHNMLLNMRINDFTKENLQKLSNKIPEYENEIKYWTDVLE